MLRASLFAFASVLIFAPFSPAAAEEGDNAPAKRTRLILGPQLAPSWPGADRLSIGPYVDAARSPVTSALGSSNQPSVGIALSYTFGGGR